MCYANQHPTPVISPTIWKALSPWIPHLTNLVKESLDKQTDGKYFPNEQPDRIPQLGWVFFRKYSPDTDRKSLKMHVDSNMHTLNIALNDDFEGGGLFYVKPPIEQEESEDDRPDISDEYKNYQWLNTLKRENTTDIVFPTLQAGDVLVHNFTVWHAVAPIEVGTRYSFVLFYDMVRRCILLKIVLVIILTVNSIILIMHSIVKFDRITQRSKKTITTMKMYSRPLFIMK